MRKSEMAVKWKLSGRLTGLVKQIGRCLMRDKTHFPCKRSLNFLRGVALSV